MCSYHVGIIAPVEQYALIGKSAKLNCSVTVNGAQIYWYSYEDPSVNGSVAVSISAVSLRDDHAFICSVVQHMVNVLRTVHLNVLGECGGEGVRGGGDRGGGVRGRGRWGGRMGQWQARGLPCACFPNVSLVPVTVW